MSGPAEVLFPTYFNSTGQYLFGSAQQRAFALSDRDGANRFAAKSLNTTFHAKGSDHHVRGDGRFAGRTVLGEQSQRVVVRVFENLQRLLVEGLDLGGRRRDLVGLTLWRGSCFVHHG